jgi:hypothetical protein
MLDEPPRTLRYIDLTRHKISDREPGVVSDAVKRWMANTQNVDCTLARGSLVAWLGVPVSEPHCVVENPSITLTIGNQNR